MAFADASKRQTYVSVVISLRISHVTSKNNVHDRIVRGKYNLHIVIHDEHINVALDIMRNHFSTLRYVQSLLKLFLTCFFFLTVMHLCLRIKLSGNSSQPENGVRYLRRLTELILSD